VCVEAAGLCGRIVRGKISASQPGAVLMGTQGCLSGSSSLPSAMLQHYAMISNTPCTASSSGLPLTAAVKQKATDSSRASLAARCGIAVIQMLSKAQATPAYSNAEAAAQAAPPRMLGSCCRQHAGQYAST
jgi:hypothetical protein